MAARKSLPAEYASITIRLAAPEDYDLLFAFFEDARAEDFSPLGWDTVRLSALLHQQLDAQRLDYAVRFPDSQQRIAMLSGSPVALVWVHYGQDEIRLLDFVVRTSRRNMEIGSTLLRLLQAESHEAGLPLRHMVALQNTSARRLYERLGFSVTDDAGSHLLLEWIPG